MRKVKLSYLIVIPFLALLLTVVVLIGASNEISLADLFGQGDSGSRHGSRLYEAGRDLQLAVDAFLAVVLNWRLIVFFVISLLATVLTSLFAWRALQIYLTSASRPVSPTRDVANPAELQAVKPAQPSMFQKQASRSAFAVMLSGAVSALTRVFQSAAGMMLYARAWRSGLAGRLGGTLSALLILLGCLILGTVYYELYGLIQRQVSQRALTTAMNLGDAVAEQFLAKGDLAVHALLGKYSMTEEVAYIFLTDREGKILAHNLPLLPAELQGSSAATGPFQRITLFRGGPVLETSVPIDHGRLGMAYYGIWKAAIDRQVYHDLVPILGVVAVGIVAGIALSLFLARRITRPIMVLKEGADRMSRGEFDKPVGVEPFDDFGELATSLERLRSSLNAAFVRLNRE